jgi:peptide/nickel transport system substrate-binding protein
VSNQEEVMHGNRLRATFALITIVTLVVACGRSTGGTATTTGLITTTPAGTKGVDKIVWDVYRETNSLDPIYAFDYPENTVIAVMCEELLTQAPDGAIGPGLATLSYPDPTTMVFDLKPGITFWDGNPLTPDDVVYSLNRNTDAALGGFYSQVYGNVKSIAATGPSQVTITLTKPDYWLADELAGTSGWIVEKSYVIAKGKDFGTAAGGTMCTGSYKLQSWKPGDVLSVVRNDSYWNTKVKPLVREIDFKGAPVGDAALTAALETGDVNGYYAFAISTLDQLKASNKVTVVDGAGWNVDAFIVSSFAGALGDVRVRQALSMSIDRKAMIAAIFKGGAQMPKALTPPGTWGYSRSIFQKGYDALPDIKQDIPAATKLIQEAGATGKTITIGMSSELNDVAIEAGAYQAAGQAIGLNVKLKSVSAANYINFFIDPNARVGIDGFFTTNYGNYADPAGLLSTFVLPAGNQNYPGSPPSTGPAYDDPQVIALMNAARSEPNLDKRAQDVVDAQKLIMADLPWIPDAFPNSEVIMSSNLTGAVASFAYMFAPWANALGGK